MTRALELNRDQAEALDDILLAHVLANRETFDVRLIDVAEQLRETWGWSRWDKRQVPVIGTEEYEGWLDRVKAWLTDWIAG